ncbi:Vegetative incompatibility protein HET-E-1 [Ceratobasidium theobromae]|uniref:Vegetative incompatibility protein HET-E-1 n=1 Tax=Ceratobasidium theobromae TaxID=1582974 RepID=A0A5N5QGY0_9AGAM|nr:Vegetative incompatibility protein HET-E-1 [Ceratobasidium theobromae]
MDPEPGGIVPERPYRRWYHRFYKKHIAQPSSESEPHDSPTRPPSVRSATSRVSPPPPVPEPGPTPPAVHPPNPGFRHTAREVFRAALEVLNISELFMPLRLAIEELVLSIEMTEAVSTNRRGYQQLAEDLMGTLETLVRHLGNSTSAQMTETITNILRDGENAIKAIESIEERRSRRMMVGGILAAQRDEEDLREIHMAQQGGTTTQKADAHTPHPVQPSSSSPGADNTARRAFGTTLQGLQDGATVFPPLHSAIAATSHQDQQKMASDLEITLESLLQCLVETSRSTQMTNIVDDIMKSIYQEAQAIKALQGRSTTRRILYPEIDAEVAQRYRRIGQLARRLQLEVDMSEWSIRNTHQMEVKLRALGPAKLAIHNSTLSGELDRRTCTENTRTSIISELISWSDDPDASRVFWMDGMAGTGKTTIACTLAQALESRRQLAASFFCTRTSHQCRDVNRIVPTIAYQLARFSTPFQFALCEAMQENPEASSLNISAQFKLLLENPLLRIKDALPNNLLVVVDALDECEDNRGVRTFLDVLLSVNLPLKFFITSRPEAVIREKMVSSNISGSISHLHSTERSWVRADIELYLRHELSFMAPDPSELERLAALADNLFAYAAAAVRYIRSEKHGADPRERLASVLSAESENWKKFGTIDSMYARVLSAALEDARLELRERERILRVLWTAVCAREPISVESLAALSGLVSSNQALVALRPLRSVLYVEETCGLVSTLHASFADYMFTKARSGQFFCDKDTHDQYLARRSLEVMREQLRFNICNLESSFLLDREVPDLDDRINVNISPALSYVCRYWIGHLKSATPSDELCGMVGDFFSQRLLFWMEVINLKKCMVTSTQELMELWPWLEAAGAPSDLVKIASDAYKFVARFTAHPISRSTPHIYISALPFCPPSSFVSVHYRQRVQGLMRVGGTAITRLEHAALITWETDSAIVSIAFSPDGERVVSGSEDGSISVRYVHDDRAIISLPKGHSDVVSSVGFSPDGNRIVSGSYDRTIRMWDGRDGTPISGPFTGHTNRVRSVAFSPDGAYIVSGSDDCAIIVWHAHSGTLAAGPFIGHTNCVNSVGYSPDGAHIVSGSNDHTVWLWDVNTGDPIIRPFEGHTDWVTSVGFSPNGKQIISGSRDCTIRVWNIRDGTLAIDPIEGHSSFVESVAYSPDGALIVSSSHDQTVRAWHAKDGTPAIGPFEGHTDCVNSARFSPDGARIVSGSKDRNICIWDVSNAPSPTFPSMRGLSSATLAEFSPDGTLVASSLNNQTIHMKNTLDGTLVTDPLEGHTQKILSIAFSSDSTRIASASADHTIRVWHARKGTLIAGPFEGHNDSVTSVVFSPDDLHIASGSDDCTCCMWDASNGALVAGPFKGHTGWVNSVAFSPDGTCIASGSYDRSIRTWSIIGGNQILDPFLGHMSPVTSVCYSPDGSRVVSGSWDGKICVWDVGNRKLVCGTFKEHTRAVNCVSFSPDSSFIISSSDDRIVHIWDLRSKSLTAPPFHAHLTSLTSVRFLPNSVPVISGNDHAIRAEVGPNAQWDVRDDGWVVDAESRMIFWASVEIRRYFRRLDSRLTVSLLGTFQMELDDMLLGEDWHKCWPDL